MKSSLTSTWGASRRECSPLTAAVNEPASVLKAAHEWAVNNAPAGALESSVHRAPSCADRCKTLLTEKCAALGDGGAQGGLFSLRRREPINGSLACSGHGKCTTDWRECGLGGSDDIATPCCSCDMGFAGPGCDELDARFYPMVGMAALLLLLLVLMMLGAAYSAVCKPRISAGLTEPLLESPS